MEFHPDLPIYLQVMTAIKRDIVTGRLALGEKLLSVRDLRIFGIMDAAKWQAWFPGEDKRDETTVFCVSL